MSDRRPWRSRSRHKSPLRLRSRQPPAPPPVPGRPSEPSEPLPEFIEITLDPEFDYSCSACEKLLFACNLPTHLGSKKHKSNIAWQHSQQEKQKRLAASSHVEIAPPAAWSRPDSARSDVPPLPRRRSLDDTGMPTDWLPSSSSAPVQFVRAASASRAPSVSSEVQRHAAAMMAEMEAQGCSSKAAAAEPPIAVAPQTPAPPPPMNRSEAEWIPLPPPPPIVQRREIHLHSVTNHNVFHLGPHMQMQPQMQPQMPMPIVSAPPMFHPQLQMQQQFLGQQPQLFPQLIQQPGGCVMMPMQAAPNSLGSAQPTFYHQFPQMYRGF